MNIQELIDQYGAYYLGEGGAENRQRLFSRMYQVSVTAAFFRIIVAKGTTWRAARALLESVVQGFQKQWTPKGNLNITPKEIPLHHLKIDIEEIPADLEETWVGFLTQQAAETGESLDRLAVEKWPFVRWYIEEHLLASRDNDIENNEIFWGEFIEPVSGTPNPDGANMNGIRKKLLSRRDIAVPEVTVINTGALETDPSDFVAQVEKFVIDIRNAKPYLANKPLQVFTTTAREERFRTGNRLLYARDNDIREANRFGEVLDKNAKVYGLPSMNSNPRNPSESSSLLFCTFAENMVRPQRFSPDTIMAKSGPNPRAVQIFTDWWMAVDFVHDDLVFVNELDSLTPQS
jgi:hypothetical protein